LTLALRSPMRALVDPLSQAMEKLSADDKPRAIAAIGRAGGPDAVKKLAAEVEKHFGGGDDAKTDKDKKDAKADKDKEDAKADQKVKKADKQRDARPAPCRVSQLVIGSLFALATMAGEEARDALNKLLVDARFSKEDAIGRAAVRAAIVRAIVRSDAPDA